MAFDKVFSGDPSLQDVAAPGSHQNPSFGVDVVNKDLYISAGSGWEPITGAGGAAGSSSELQYNDSGSVAGAAGGTTNGTHFALGAGSTINDAPTTAPVGHTLSPNVILGVSESSTDPNLENGLYVGLTLNPASPASGNAAYGQYTKVNLNGGNLDTAGIITGNYTQVFNNSTSEIPLIVGVVGESISTGSGITDSQFGGFFAITATGSGPVGDFIPVQTFATIAGSGPVDNVVMVEMAFGTQGNGSVINSFTGFDVASPSVANGDTLTTAVGVHIQEQKTANVGTAYQLYSDGTAPSLFAGPVELPYIKAQTVYSAAGTPLPSAVTAGVGARAFVSDATANVYGTAYASGGSIKAPVYSDGTTWNMG